MGRGSEWVWGRGSEWVWGGEGRASDDSIVQLTPPTTSHDVCGVDRVKKHSPLTDAL